MLAGVSATAIIVGHMLTARGADFVRKPLTIVVGPGGSVATVAQAARLAHSGDTIEVEAGDYVGDVASWSQDDLTVRAVGGRVRIIAHGNDAESKAIWVIKGTRVVVEGIEFTGAERSRLERCWNTPRGR